MALPNFEDRIDMETVNFAFDKLLMNFFSINSKNR